ncbi:MULTISPECIES: antitoxin Xre-like helix-turn-helix domain-containing protein [Pseudomonas]|jgi:hypothetical protein|uniref:antitoxin Xre-like helix-turn-helix domain-containing protein n=1 Tax=Pseudomonas TaxID=286 RepID=UPI000A84BEC7|nr:MULTISPECIES: antitoxin Xre-like helix-turn-helix domain-containing protein [Pseudomonas]MCE0778702.1 hypothetical protein [Pseudomonas sp. NMI542_15]MDD1985650.1 hypothetical protein [Pseudomonas putida]MDD2118342.1 hypothetical protein [Pseudomonas putida]UPU92464.1 hypothetical protein M0766_27495 [Pseudomonas putida]HDS1727842.1 hypothetical protein [Pseudomonas putida]
MTGANAELTQNQLAVGLRAALRILDGWNATAEQVRSILRISIATRQRISRDSSASVRLDLDQQQRISLVLNIHASLRAVFANQENVQGFPLLENANDFFEGRSPLEVMAQGDMISLYETYRRIEHLHQSS